MPISSFERKRVSKLLNNYCDRRIPRQMRDKLELRFRFDGNSVVLYERRPAWNRPGEWTESTVAKDLIGPSRVFEDFLSEIDEDPTGISWG